MKLSVALPTYNGEQYLSEQLESILSQTRRPDEIVIYDDKSTDGTVTLAREYEAEYPDCIQVYAADENRGVAGNFERAIAACTGDTIALSDQDDIWHEAKLETQLEAFESSDGSLVTHNSRYLVDEEVGEKTLWDTVPCDPTTVTDNPKATLQALLRQNFVQGATMLFDSDLKTAILPIPESFLYDHWITLQAALVAGIVPLDECYLHYRIHEEQAHGGSDSLLADIRTELSRDSETYRRYVERWEVLQRRLSELDSSRLLIDQATVERLVRERQQFDSYRYMIYRNESTRINRIRGLQRAVNARGYGKFSHPGLVCTDILGVIRNLL